MNTLNKYLGASTFVLCSILFISELKPTLGDSCKSHDLVVKLVTPVGKIRGHELRSAKGQNYFAFQEIPYGKPPVDQLRYQIPQRHSGWKGVLNTTKNTKMCAQPGTTIVPNGEDCLYLNVYSPVKPGSSAKLAVYVWIPGGGFAVWDGTYYRYSPEFLIDYNIVIVTMNYRLGALGFLATDDGIIPGNLGLRDQHLAIKWVHENIHLFGGDPNKVTIGGESAGSNCVGFQILSSMNKGLFRGAILQTGGALNTYAYVASPSIYAYQLGQLIDSSVDPKNTSTSQLLEILQKANINDILVASLKVPPIEKGGLIVDDLVWAPTLEKKYKVEPFISKPMHESLINGDFNQVPLFIGFNSEEMVWFLPTSNSTIAFKLQTWAQFDEKRSYLEADSRRIVHPDLNIAESNRMEAGNLIKKLYTNSSFTNDAYGYLKISSDFFFIHGTIRQADTSSKYVPVYLYRFDYMAKTHSQFPGAQHTEELQYLWKSFEDSVDVNKFQPILRHRLCKIWSNFIKYLNPTPSPDQSLGNLSWPKVQPNDIKYVNINETFKIDSNPRMYSEVRSILNKYQEAPFIVY